MKTVKRILGGVLAIACLSIVQDVRAEENNHRLGVGANYWVSLDNIDDSDVKEDGFSYMATYQYWYGMLGLEADVEYNPDEVAPDLFAPQGYVLLGKAIYIGAGVGVVYVDGEFANDPFYALKAGLDLEVLPSLFLDVFAQYRFNRSLDIDDVPEDIDTDTVFLGAAVRLGF